ncbi:MAG: hypothetical protein ACQESS_08990 [Bacillota bacterium]
MDKEVWWKLIYACLEGKKTSRHIFPILPIYICWTPYVGIFRKIVEIIENCRRIFLTYVE